MNASDVHIELERRIPAAQFRADMRFAPRHDPSDLPPFPRASVGHHVALRASVRNHVASRATHNCRRASTMQLWVGGTVLNSRNTPRSTGDCPRSQQNRDALRRRGGRLVFKTGTCVPTGTAATASGSGFVRTALYPWAFAAFLTRTFFTRSMSSKLISPVRRTVLASSGYFSR